MKRGSIFFILVLCVTAILCLPTYAAETETSTAPELDSEVVEETKVETETEFTSETEPEEPDDFPEINHFWAGVSEWIDEHKTEILSAASAVASVIVGVLYKTGLLPKFEAFKTGLTSTVSDFLGSIKSSTEEKMNAIDKVIGHVDEISIHVDKVVEQSAKEREQMLAVISAQKNQLAEYKEVMKAQEQMIYQALMSTNLSTARRNAIDEEHLKNIEKIDSVVHAEVENHVEENP